MILLSRTTSTTWGLHNAHTSSHSLFISLSLWYSFLSSLPSLCLSLFVILSFSHTHHHHWRQEGGSPAARGFGSLYSSLCALLLSAVVLFLGGCVFVCVCVFDDGSLESVGSAPLLRLSRFFQVKSFLQWISPPVTHRDYNTRHLSAFVVFVPRQDFITVC